MRKFCLNVRPYSVALSLDQVSLMFAVVKLAGKQHIVRENGVIITEKLDYVAGDTFSLSGGDVIFSVGAQSPKKEDESHSESKQDDTFSGLSTVSFEVLEQKRNKTILIFKKKRRKNYRRMNGHRQPVTVLRVKGISFG